MYHTNTLLVNGTFTHINMLSNTYLYLYLPLFLSLLVSISHVWENSINKKVLLQSFYIENLTSMTFKQVA